MEIEVGSYITDGFNDLLVNDISEYEGQKYACVYDEKNDILYFYKMIRENEGWKFDRVISDSLTRQLIIHFSGIKDMIKEEKIDELSDLISGLGNDEDDIIDED